MDPKTGNSRVLNPTSLKGKGCVVAGGAGTAMV
jgi:hypothetical protein